MHRSFDAPEMAIKSLRVSSSTGDYSTGGDDCLTGGDVTGTDVGWTGIDCAGCSKVTAGVIFCLLSSCLAVGLAYNLNDK